MMCGVAQPVPPPCAQLSIALSHTCAPHPSCCLPFTVSSVMCPHRRESVLVLSLRCHCPAVRVHNHTVLPSSHNSSYVYTNDSAFTNISATVGENQTLFALTEMYRGHQTALLCFPVCDFILSYKWNHFARSCCFSTSCSSTNLGVVGKKYSLEEQGSQKV